MSLKIPERIKIAETGLIGNDHLIDWKKKDFKIRTESGSETSYPKYRNSALTRYSIGFSDGGPGVTTDRLRNERLIQIYSY